VFFNGHYDTWRYLPLVPTLTLNDGAEQYLRDRPATGEQSGQARLRGDSLYSPELSHRRRLIINAEVVRRPGHEPKCNPRFVVTNLREAPAPSMASIVSAATWRISSRNDTTDWRWIGWANQFHALLTAAAYVLVQAHGTDCARAQVSTRRERLLKLAV
jgi:hypothetical protein